MLAFVSMSSHLIADSLTWSGTPLLWPYETNFTFLGGPVRTGTFVEVIICIAAVILLLV